MTSDQQNWAGNYTYHAARFHYPETIEELQEIVRSCTKLRVLGSRHSFNGIADSTEDIVSLEEQAGHALGWTAAVRPAENDIVLLLKDARVLPSTSLWMSNGGRDYAPWNGRHIGVLGIEDSRSYGTGGHRAAISPNPLREADYPTAFDLSTNPTIRYAIGAVAMPAGWTRIATVSTDGTTLTLRDVGGFNASIHKNIVGTGRAATEAEKMELSRAQGRNDQILMSLEELRGNPATPANVASALEKMNTAYVERFGHELKLAREGAASGKYEHDVETFYAESQRGLNSVVDLRDAFYDNAERTLAAAYSSARLSFLIALAGLAAVLIAGVGIVIMVRRRVCKPIVELTDRMSRLAAGDVAQDIPGAGRGDEDGVGGGAECLHEFAEDGRYWEVRHQVRSS